MHVLQKPTRFLRIQIAAVTAVSTQQLPAGQHWDARLTKAMVDFQHSMNERRYAAEKHRLYIWRARARLRRALSRLRCSASSVSSSRASRSRRRPSSATVLLFSVAAMPTISSVRASCTAGYNHVR